MFPYQIHQALADQRIRDLIAEAHGHDLAADARRHRRLVAAQLAATDMTVRSSRLRAGVAQFLTVLHVRGRAVRELNVSPDQGAGPMGCVA
ncbi:MAG: hypothetical protein QOF35_2002 [Actinomycetota bacterium]|jgi:hypothetical protein|nr:hypothetical protein [Actinomycetota bacterium]